jgi:hypothetical protein
VWVRGITTCTAKTRYQSSNTTRADGKALSQLTDCTFSTVISGQDFLAHIYSIGSQVIGWHSVALETFSSCRRVSGKDSPEKRLND